MYVSSQPIIGLTVPKGFGAIVVSGVPMSTTVNDVGSEGSEQRAGGLPHYK